MLKTYRIIPLVFILFLVGFTLFTVSPVFAQEQWNPSMGMRHPDRPCMKSNSCGQDTRTSDQIASDPWDNGGTLMPNAAQSPEQVSTSPSGGEVAQLNARITKLKYGLKYAYQKEVSSRCRTSFLKDRLNSRLKDTLPFHGQQKVLNTCFDENYEKDYRWNTVKRSLGIE